MIHFLEGLRSQTVYRETLKIGELSWEECFNLIDEWVCGGRADTRKLLRLYFVFYFTFCCGCRIILWLHCFLQFLKPQDQSLAREATNLTTYCMKMKFSAHGTKQ